MSLGISTRDRGFRPHHRQTVVGSEKMPDRSRSENWVSLFTEQYPVEEVILVNMSDVEEQIIDEVAVEQQQESSVSIEDALRIVLRTSLVHDGLARGLREASKALSRGEAKLCVLCDSVTEESIIKLVEALCNEPDEKIPLIKVSDAKLLGEWAGLCQLDQEGNARKVVGASCVVVKNWGADSDERNILLEHFSQQ